MDGQVLVRTGEDGKLKYHQYHNIEEDVQNLMDKWLTKNSSQTTVSSREKGLRRREAQVSSHKRKKLKRTNKTSKCASAAKEADEHTSGMLVETCQNA